MNVETHWEKIYREKAPDAVSWYRPHLETSLALIERAAPERGVSIIDVGGGESTLVDDLLAHGYQNITVLDVSQTAIAVTKKRLGSAAEEVQWVTADIVNGELAPNAYDVWHDRAVFHFLTAMDQRLAYVRQVARSEAGWPCARQKFFWTQFPQRFNRSRRMIQCLGDRPGDRHRADRMFFRERKLLSMSDSNLGRIDLGSSFLANPRGKKHPISNILTLSKGFDRQLSPAEG